VIDATEELKRFLKAFPDSCVDRISTFEAGDLIWWYRPPCEWERFMAGEPLPPDVPSLLISCRPVREGAELPHDYSIRILSTYGRVEEATVACHHFFRRQRRQV
jgi:hypothetical protein